MIRVINVILAAFISFILVAPAEADRAFQLASGLIGETITIGDAGGAYGVFYNNELTVGDSPATQLASLDGQFIARRQATNAKVRIQSYGTSVQNYLAFDAGSGTVASRGTMALNQAFGSVVGVGCDGTDCVDHGPEVQLYATQAWTNTAHGSSVKILGVLNGTTAQIPLIWAGLGGTGHVYIPSGDLILSTTGTTLEVDSGTAASACAGTGTHNGTTTVTISTTCAATGARIFIQDTSEATTFSGCWYNNIVNGTSFDTDCKLAGQDATFVWWIQKEG